MRLAPVLAKESRVKAIRASVKGAVLVVVVFALLLASGGFVTPSAQGDPFHALLVKLDQIIAILTPAAGGTIMLATPLVRAAPFPEESGFCALANVGTATIGQVRIRSLDFEGNVLNDDTRLDVVPGASALAQIIQVVSSDLMRCEFTFEGTATAVRANLLVSTPTTTRLSVDAR